MKRMLAILLILGLSMGLSGMVKKDEPFGKDGAIQAHSVQLLRHPTHANFVPPNALNLCGEQMPLEKRAVWEMLDREFTIAVHNHAQVTLWLKRAGRYFPYIERTLAEHDMPADL